MGISIAIIVIIGIGIIPGAITIGIQPLGRIKGKSILVIRHAVTVIILIHNIGKAVSVCVQAIESAYKISFTAFA